VKKKGEESVRKKEEAILSKYVIGSERYYNLVCTL
jgi:hypothetical protein